MATNLLDDLSIKAARPKPKQYTLRDGNGIFLLVHPNGSKYFQLRTTLNGKQKLIRIGVYPNYSLAQARVKALEAINLVNSNLDPIVEKKIAQQKAKDDADATFKTVASDWIAIKKKTLAKSTITKINQSFASNVYRKIGDIPIKKIDNLMVRQLLLVIEKRGATEMAEKTRSWIKQVFDFSLADHLIDKNPIPAKDLRLTKHVSNKFPGLHNTYDAGKFLRSLVDYNGSFQSQSCATLIMHLATRPSELRLAEWSEFDLNNAVWSIPVERMKTRLHMSKPHQVFLSQQVLEILSELKEHTVNEKYLFAARASGKPLSDGTLAKVFRTCFVDYHIVPHACRHFMSTQANESGLFRNDVIEAALSHKDTNKIRAVYNESTYDAERKQLMQWWSDQLDNMRDGAKVIAIKKGYPISMIDLTKN